MSPEVLQVLVEKFQSLVMPVSIVAFMIVVGERLLQALEPLVKPALLWLQRKLHMPDGWFMMLFSWVVVGAIVALTETNIFAPFIPDPRLGQILTAIFCGGGSNLLHDVWPTPQTRAR